ncbi:SRPBCC family protein [Chitinophaga solisilvae]|uniref:SRPBCC domain-containing protein n=1 Tax=Chitinophaga solisilvae TaxID=1233460 RepID=A0A3S1CYD9_9BACT|nr:SRPBCC domain-containing protein [Chitinophaga solisilvae]NSL85872.1 SRPBCC domain-containing protein [Chitinophaga solisilvae]
MANIWHKLVIKASPEEVYKAVTTQEGLAGWWTPETIAKPETGSILRFSFGPDYFKEMKVTRLTPSSQVEWVCVQAFEDWIGTTVSFNIEPHKNGAVLLFRHDGWKEYTPSMASCTYDWAMFLRSLRLLCETGKGLAYPHQYE